MQLQTCELVKRTHWLWNEKEYYIKSSIGCVELNYTIHNTKGAGEKYVLNVETIL